MPAMPMNARVNAIAVTEVVYAQDGRAHDLHKSATAALAREAA